MEQHKADQHQADRQETAPATSMTTAPREKVVPHHEERVIDPDSEDIEQMREHPRRPEPFRGSDH